MEMWTVRSERVVLPDGMRPAAVHVHEGRITAIGHYADRLPGARDLDAGTAVVMPGLVDTHVHINDPGRADWEGFESATRAAAAGGVTTIVDMPLNSVPATTSAEGVEAKRRAAAGRCHVDVGFWGGVVPGNAADIEPMARAGVLGFKCLLSPSGVDEFGHVSEWDLRQAMPIVAAAGLPLLVHAEWPGLLSEPDPRADPRRYATWLNSHPPAAEHAAIDLLIRLARHTGARVHIVHVASADAVPAIVAARAEGLQITAETCPHYLTFRAEDIANGATPFKCAPPIREGSHRDRLWQALAADQIDVVATDHSPAPPSLKHIDDGDFVEAWGGIASLQLGLAVVWTGGSGRGLTVERLARWMSAGPARLAGLARKGAISVGLDADLVVFDPDAAFTVDATALYHRHAVTPYDGAQLHGRVLTTMLRGEIVFADGECRRPASGRLVRNGQAL